MELSQHASARAQQRCVPKACVDMILEYGTTRRHCGRTYEIQIRRKDKNRIIQNLKRMIQMVEKSSRKALLVDHQMKTIITMYDH